MNARTRRFLLATAILTLHTPIAWGAQDRRTVYHATFLQSNEFTVCSVAFSPDGKTLAAGYNGQMRGLYHDCGVVLWDVAGRKRVIQASLPVKEALVSLVSVAFSPDGKTLAAGYSLGPKTGGGVVLWDMAGAVRV